MVSPTLVLPLIPAKHHQLVCNAQREDEKRTEATQKFKDLESLKLTEAGRASQCARAVEDWACAHLIAFVNHSLDWLNANYTKPVSSREARDNLRQIRRITSYYRDSAREEFDEYSTALRFAPDQASNLRRMIRKQIADIGLALETRFRTWVDGHNGARPKRKGKARGRPKGTGNKSLNRDEKSLLELAGEHLNSKTRRTDWKGLARDRRLPGQFKGKSPDALRMLVGRLRTNE